MRSTSSSPRSASAASIASRASHLPAGERQRRRQLEHQACAVGGAVRAGEHLLEPLDRGLARDPRLDAGQLEQDVAPNAWLRRLGQRPLQVGRRRVGRAAPGRVGGRLAQAIDDPVVGGRLGPQQVAGQLQRRPLLGRQQLGRAAVADGAAAGRHRLADRVADDRVHERERPSRQQDLRHREIVRAGGDGGGRQPRERRHASDRRRSQHRNGAGHLGVVRAERVEPQEDRATDGSRSELEHRGRIGAAAVAQAGEQLAQVEGVAAGRLVTAAAQRVARVLAEHVTHDLGRRLGAQRLQRQRPLAGRRRQPVEQLALRLGPVGAGGADEQQRHALEPPREIDEGAQRRRVRPVGVVGDQQQRRPVGEVRTEPVETVDDGVDVGSVLAAAEPEQWPGQRRRPGQQLGPLVGLGAQRRSEQLAGDAERELGVELGAGAQQRRQALLLAGRQDGRDERRLAHSRRALDQQQAAVAAAGGAR